MIDTKLILNLNEKVKMELVMMPAGKFMMGSPKHEKGRSCHVEGPEHEVKIAKPFYMGIYPVTQEQWEAIMGVNPYQSGKGSHIPTNCVNWDDCQIFCRVMSAKVGRKVRLPSEAEREYACRAGTTTRFYWGNDPDCKELPKYGCVGCNSDGYLFQVGKEKPNPWGLYDMIGNVWEWCQDWFHDSYAGAPADGRAWEEPAGIMRILRGGCDNSVGRECRSASRDWGNPGNRCGDVGFRVVGEFTGQL